MRKKYLAVILSLTLAVGLSACSVQIGKKDASENAASSDTSSSGGTSDQKASDSETSEKADSGDTASSRSGETDSGTATVDFSAYPKELNDWKAEDMKKYFQAAGVFVKDDWIYIQDHKTYYTGTVLDEGVGYEDEAETITVAIFSFDLNNKDAEKAMKEAASQKKLSDDLSGIELTHMLGKFAFDYNLTTDETVYNGMEAAFKQLEEHFGMKADF